MFKLFNKFFSGFFTTFFSPKIGKQARNGNQGYYAICREDLLVFGNANPAVFLRKITLAVFGLNATGVNRAVATINAIFLPETWFLNDIFGVV